MHNSIQLVCLIVFDWFEFVDDIQRINQWSAFNFRRLSVADTKKRASNIFQQAKNYLAKTNKAEMVFTMKSTFSADNEKKYLGGRIWRFK